MTSNYDMNNILMIEKIIIVMLMLFLSSLSRTLSYIKQATITATDTSVINTVPTLTKLLLTSLLLQGLRLLLLPPHATTTTTS